MIEATHKKLREARFFLDQMERELTSAGHNPVEAFEFYLSAFLSAARSVTFILEAEEQHKYPEWSRAWRETRSEKEKQMLARFTSARNRALKRETPAVAYDRTASSILYPPGSLPAEFQFIFDDDDQPFVPYRTITSRLVPDGVEEEVVPHCRKYLDLLTELVAAFLNANSQPIGQLDIKTFPPR